MEQMSKNLVATSKLTEAALVSLIDVCRAASRSPPQHETILHSFAAEIADDIKV